MKLYYKPSISLNNMSNNFDFMTNQSMAETGISSAKKFITTYRLKSMWDNNGFGWQELLLSADHAGFYATCEGIEILGHQSNGSFLIDDEIIQGAYHNHLLKIIDPIVKSDDSCRQQQRDETLSQTCKLAKFIKITSKMPDLFTDNENYRKVIDLLKESQLDDGGWSPVIPKAKNASAASSAEALIALFLSGHTKSTEFLKGLNWAESILETYLKNKDSKKDFSDPLIVAWGLSEIIGSLNDKQKKLLGKSVIKLIDNGISENEKDIFKVYYVKKMHRNDYYNFNNQLLISTVILNCITKKIVNVQLIYNIIEIIAQINLQFNEKGYFCQPNLEMSSFYQNRNVRFLWY